jgi:hypothetical protein
VSRPYFAYLDTNVVRDFSEPRPPVDRAMRTELLRAIEEGRLVILFSEAVAQETAAVSLHNRKKAEQLARFYLKVASLDHALDATGVALGQAIRERLGDSPSYYKALTLRERRHVKLRLLGKAGPQREAIVAAYRRETETWANNTRGYRDRARAEMANEAAAHKPMDLGEATRSIWPGLAPDWARETVDTRGLLARARDASLSDEDLLDIPGLRAAVGVAVGLAVAQTINARNPDLSDYGDFQHVSLAACAGLPLVTHDERLRRLVNAIPDRPLEVISAAELLARLR